LRSLKVFALSKVKTYENSGGAHSILQAWDPLPMKIQVNCTVLNTLIKALY